MVLYEAFKYSEHHYVCFFVRLISNFEGGVIKLIERLHVLHQLLYWLSLVNSILDKVIAGRNTLQNINQPIQIELSSKLWVLVTWLLKQFYIDLLEIQMFVEQIYQHFQSVVLVLSY